jgi:RHS repeat-associated protein
MSWTYDRYGNRLTQVLNGSTQTVNPSTTTNRLNLTYDANGNLTNDGIYGLTWDAENRMVSYAGASVTNQYDANSFRVRRTKQSGADGVYIFAGGKVIAEYTPGAVPSSPSVEYVYLGSGLIASKASSTYTFYERDRLSIRGVLSDASPGSPTEQGSLPFGENWYGSNLKWKFTSYERDSDVGDDFAVFRRHQYVYGRFSSADPVLGSLADPQSWNRYTYVRNDSVRFTDPFGLATPYPPPEDPEEGGGGGGDWFNPFDCYDVYWDGMLFFNTCNTRRNPPGGGNPVTTTPANNSCAGPNPPSPCAPANNANQPKSPARQQCENAAEQKFVQTVTSANTQRNNESVKRILRGETFSFAVGCVATAEVGCVEGGAATAVAAFPGVFVGSYIWGSVDYAGDIWHAYQQKKQALANCPN